MPKKSTVDVLTKTIKERRVGFSSLLRKARAEWKGAVALSVEDVEDLKKLYSYHLIFNTNTPQGLLNKIVLEMMFYFCRREQENLHNLCVQDFEIINSNGQCHFRIIKKSPRYYKRNWRHRGMNVRHNLFWIMSSSVFRKIFV